MKTRGRPKKKASEALKESVALKLYEHQQAAEDAYAAGYRRFFLPWHRRAGKDIWSMDFVHRRMKEEVGTYWHLFPFHVQAKRAIWNGIDARDGMRFIDRAFPIDQRTKVNESELSISMYGSMWQMLGSDNYDRAVGSNPRGIIFSEWALCDPMAWEYFRPILIENGGWAIFITTFRGRNHAWRMWDSVKDLTETWYCDLRTIADTHRHNGKPIVSVADVEEERRAGMREDKIQQEFYCNPNAANTGAIFNRSYNRLVGIEALPCTTNNRILRVAWGVHNEGITAVIFQDHHIIAVHSFLESNLTDAAATVARRHPNALLAHHAMNPDPVLFSELDGYGVAPAMLEKDEHVQHAHCAAMLNTCNVTPSARETLADFAMSFAPFRDEHVEEDQLTHESLMQAVAVMHTAQRYTNPGRVNAGRKLDYSRYDRGVI